MPNDASGVTVSISEDERLDPQVTVASVDGEPTELLNADAVIKLMREAKTPEARELWLAYRRAKIDLKRRRHSLSGSKLRSEALMTAMRKTGLNLVATDSDH